MFLHFLLNMTPHPEHPEHTYTYDLELDTWDPGTMILKRETWNVPGPTTRKYPTIL